MSRTIIFDLDRTLYINKELTDYQEEVIYQFVADKTRLPIEEAKKQFDVHRTDLQRLLGMEVCKSGLLVIFYSSLVEWNEYWQSRVSPDGYIGRDEQLINTFQRLRKQDYRLVIASNSTEKFVRRTAELLGIEADLVGRDTVYSTKPSIDFFLATTQLLRVNPKDCISVGDRDSDIYPANVIGIRGIKVGGVSDVYTIDEHIKRLEQSGKLNLVL